MYQVIIVEDDPMVAEIDKQYVEHNSGSLSVAGVFHNGQDALEFIRSNPVDLVLLDYYMPIMDGRTFLMKLRSEGIMAEVIMVTAASEAGHIGELYAYGVSDYLIKPFDYSRFQTSLQRFISRRDAFSAERTLNQEELDRVISPDVQRGLRLMDKGIHPVTLELICSFLREHKNEKLSIDALSKNVALSRVTLRRYMNYLIDKNLVVGSVDYYTGGRPSAMYTYIGS